MGRAMRFSVFALAAAMGCLLLSDPAAADWTVIHGARKVLGFPPTGTVARVPATAPSHGFSASLQIECFDHPEVGGRVLGVILSRETAPGFLAYRYQLDDAPAIVRPPEVRTSLTSHALTPFPAGLSGAQRLDLVLTPASGPALSFRFDVRGADRAIRAIPCRGR